MLEKIRILHATIKIIRHKIKKLEGVIIVTVDTAIIIVDEYGFIKENIYNGNIIAKRKGKSIHYGKIKKFWIWWRSGGIKLTWIG